MHPESNLHSSICSPLLVKELFPLESIWNTTVSALPTDYLTNATLIFGEMTNDMDQFLSEIMVLYQDEVDPEAFAKKYQEIADRYPALARSAHLFLDIKKY